jgi:hypothetical protein
MSKKKCFHWDHLKKLKKFTDISDYDHQIRDFNEIHGKIQESRVKWKKNGAEIRKIRTTEEKAVKAIIQAEESRMIYRKIREIIGKNKLPLTQVDVSFESNPFILYPPFMKNRLLNMQFCIVTVDILFSRLKHLL